MSADLTLISVNDLALLFKFSRSKIYELEKSGELPPRILIGKSKKWRLVDIQEYLESRRDIALPKRIVGKNKKSESTKVTKLVNLDSSPPITQVGFIKSKLTN